jgi:hypothetical protein
MLSANTNITLNLLVNHAQIALNDRYKLLDRERICQLLHLELNNFEPRLSTKSLSTKRIKQSFQTIVCSYLLVHWEKRNFSRLFLWKNERVWIEFCTTTYHVPQHPLKCQSVMSQSPHQLLLSGMMIVHNGFSWLHSLTLLFLPSNELFVCLTPIFSSYHLDHIGRNAASYHVIFCLSIH